MSWSIEQRVKKYKEIKRLNLLGCTAWQIAARLDTSTHTVYSVLNNRVNQNLKFLPYGFTPAECDVGALIASGRNSEGIAKLLFISKKTVEQHTSSIYRKLGVINQEFVSKRVAAAMILKDLFPL